MSFKKGSSIEIDVSYYVKEDSGMLQKVQEVTVKAPTDEPLQKILFKHLSLKSVDLKGEDSSNQLSCYAGNFTGESISLQESPHEILYLVDAVRCGTRPVLYLCKEPSGVPNGGTGRSSVSPDVDYSLFRERTPSFLCEKFMGTNGLPKKPSVRSTGDFDDDDDDVFDEVPLRCGPRPILRHNRTQIFSSKDTATLPSNTRSLLTDKKAKRKTLFILPKQHSRTSDDLVLGGGKKGRPLLLSATMNCAEMFEEARKRTEPPPKNTKKKLGPTNSIDISGPMAPVPPPITSPKSPAPPPTTSSVSPPITSPTSPVPPPPTPPPPVSDTGTKRTQKREQFKRRQKAFRRKSTHDLNVPRLPSEMEEVQIELADNSKMLINCHNYSTIGDLKTAIVKQLDVPKEKGKPSHGGNWQSADITLTYSIDGKDYELLNESQFLYMTEFRSTEIRMSTDILLKVNQTRTPPEKEVSLLYRISHLTGVLMDESVAALPTSKELVQIPLLDQDEVQWARRTLHDFVMEVTSVRSAEEYTLSMQLVTTEAPLILALKIPTDNKITIHFHYQSVFSFKQKVCVRHCADRVLAEIFPCVVGCKLVENRIEDYTLQVSGEESYIAGETELLSFRKIRRCILKGEEIHLSITKKPSPELDKAYQFSWFPLDARSNELPLHCHISSKPPISVREASSVWDSDENFSIEVLQVENLPLIQKTKPYSVFVSATLYHGWRKLCGPVNTEANSLKSTVQWNEEIDFEFQKKNIPKAAKILFVVSEGTVTKKQSHQTIKEKSKPRFLYWGLMSVYNHRGILRSGSYTIQLWQGKRPKGAMDIPDHDLYSAEPNPSAPATENPHPKSAKMTIRFDTCERPVIFPSAEEESYNSFFKQHPSFKNVAVKRQFKKLLTCIKEGRLYRKLPSYIVNVNWGNLSECLEVYSLLYQMEDVINSVPVEVVIKLLDSDFPDEKVRAFAIKVLEQLPADQLEDLLLQLTQALKFERTHDSLLARFLLKRALQNKRIGHFFFWYLKCEMYNPQYTPRFGVILEAYLKGCGETMLSRFTDQVEMQLSLEEIGETLKREYGKDYGKMQAALPTLLEAKSLQKYEITPVFNPRCRLGNLRPPKCKVMPSAKRPMWLELCNVHSTALTPAPVRLILKQGDDLRQDMITLRMLSLFERLWEEQGLDLELIPYGCMATGPKTGFIEVVKNAKTIAEVSGVSDNKKLYEWIKNHQTNEFGEIDPDKVKAAVKRFTVSCAGYSVATYILGIGDRHNDNIMVTTSGNLFHIDFGHFLGNIKCYMGFKREWAPFVLTPDFVYVMGGEGSEMFELYRRLCCRAFLILRRHADLIFNLFSMMRSTGIPELTCVEDTEYIRMALVLDRSEREAEEAFHDVIKKCLDLKWTVQVMWWFHDVRKSYFVGGSSS